MTKISGRWADPKPYNLAATPRVIDIVQACDLIRYSRSSWLRELCAKKYGTIHRTNFSAILKKVTRAGYIEKLDTRDDLTNAAYQPDVYTITEEGRDFLIDHRRPVVEHRFNGGGSFEHNLGCCDLLHSVRLGAELISQDAILKKSGRPLAIKLADCSLTPDALFGIKRADGTYCFYALEYDTGTESHKSKVNRKLEAYLEILRTEAYKTHWAIPNLWPLFVTARYSRKLNMINNLKKLTSGRGNSAILFKERKGEMKFAPPATDWMVSEPWDRCEYPALDLTKM